MDLGLSRRDCRARTADLGGVVVLRLVFTHPSRLLPRRRSPVEFHDELCGYTACAAALSQMRNPVALRRCVLAETIN